MEKYKEKYSQEDCPCLGVIENQRLNRNSWHEESWAGDSRQRAQPSWRLGESGEKMMCCSNWQKPTTIGEETGKRSLAVNNCEDFVIRKKDNQSGRKTWSDFHFIRITLSTVWKTVWIRPCGLWGDQLGGHLCSLRDDSGWMRLEWESGQAGEVFGRWDLESLLIGLWGLSEREGWEMLA